VLVKGGPVKRSPTKYERRSFVFQVRSGVGEDPAEILTHLTHAVWRALEKRTGPGAVDPHQWPDVFRTLRDAFKNRLSYNPRCGQWDHCRRAPCAFCGKESHDVPAAPKIYLLETRQPIARFLQIVAGLIARRLRRRPEAPVDRRKEFRSTLEQSLKDSLKEYFYVSDLCRQCPLRGTEADRRVWVRETMEQPWGGWRSLASPNTAGGTVRETW